MSNSSMSLSPKWPDTPSSFELLDVWVRAASTNYDYPQFPVADGAVQFVTMMGAPMITVTAQEIVRVVNPKTGVVILYDPSSSAIRIFEKT
jgi:hypothetical protein